MSPGSAPSHDGPTRLEALPAYLLSALTTLLWVACVLPAGHPVDPVPVDDAATPIHREPILLVPGLLLLIAVPAGCTLSRSRRGLRAVLAGTDTFVAMYVAIALWSEGLVRLTNADGTPGAIDGPVLVGSLLLLVLGVASLFEAWRSTRRRPPVHAPRVLSGLRLALCLLVLLVPLHVLLRPDVERASLLAPFLFVAISAGGVRLARDLRGLRRAAAVIQLILAAHVLVTLRYTIYRSAPTLVDVNVAGHVALGLSIATAALALLQLALLLRADPGGALPAESPQPA